MVIVGKVKLKSTGKRMTTNRFHRIHTVVKLKSTAKTTTTNRFIVFTVDLVMVKVGESW